MSIKAIHRKGHSSGRMLIRTIKTLFLMVIYNVVVSCQTYGEEVNDASTRASRKEVAALSLQLKKKVESLVPGLASDSVKTRDDAARGIVASGYLPDSLVRMALSAPRYEDRYHALIVVTQFKGLRPALIGNAALGDSDGNVVYLAVLDTHERPEFRFMAVHPLIRLLKSQLLRIERISDDSSTERPVACDAAFALGELGKAAGIAVPVLKKIAHDPLEELEGLTDVQRQLVGVSCAAALVNLDQRLEGEKCLVKFLGAEDDWVRMDAVYSILLLHTDGQIFRKRLDILAKEDQSDMVSSAAKSVLERLDSAKGKDTMPEK